MSIDIKTQLFDAFLGTQEGVHPIILPDLFSSGGSADVWLDKFGRVRSNYGFSLQGFTGTGAGITGLMPYRSVSGGTVTRKLLVVGDDLSSHWKVYSSDDNGVTFSASLVDIPGSVGRVPDSMQFGNNLYLTTGTTTPKKFDGTTLTAAGQTQSPQPTATDAGKEGNLDGYYTYKVVSVFSDASRKAGSELSDALLLHKSQANVSWTADADTTVTGYELYRTTGTGTLFYFVTALVGRATTSFTDNMTDETLQANRILSEHGDPPPSAWFCVPHKGRAWWLRTDTYPSRGYYSDPGLPESVYPFSYIDFTDSETVGDAITGGLGNFEGRLVVTTEKAIWTVSGTGALLGDITDWNRQRSNSQTGCVARRSIARVPAGAQYTDAAGHLQTVDASMMAFFSSAGDIRLFDGLNDIVISTPVKDTLANFNYAQRKWVHCLHDVANGHLIWFIPTTLGTGSGSHPDLALCWNYRHGVWYKWTCGYFASSCATDDASNANVLLTGGSIADFPQTNVQVTVGRVFKFFDSTSTAYYQQPYVPAVWMTKTIYGLDDEGNADLSHTKRWRWVDLLLRYTDAGNGVAVGILPSINLSWLTGTSSDNDSPVDTIGIVQGTSALESANGSAILSVVSSPILAIFNSGQSFENLHTVSNPDYLADTGIRIKIASNTAVNPAWSLEAMSLAYQTLPGLNRRLV